MLALFAASWAAALQPKLDFGPEIVSIPELCRAYAPEGERVAAGPEMQARFALVRLKGRTWEDVRAMLAEGAHIQIVFDSPSRTWMLQDEPQRLRADRQKVADTLDTVGRAIEKEAQAVLDRAGAQTHGFVEVESIRLREDLEAQAKRFRGEDAAEFQGLYSESLNRLIALRQLQFGHAWAQLHSLADGGLALARKPGLRVWTEDARRFRERLRLDRETTLPAQMRGTDAPIDGTMVVGESFNWSTMTCQWRHHLVHPHGQPDPYRPHTSSIEWRTRQPIIEIEKRWPGQTPSEAAAILARVPGAADSFNPSFDGVGGLLSCLRQTDVEALVEMHPLCEFRLPSRPAALADAWQSTLQMTESGPLIGKNFLIDMSGGEMQLRTFLNKYETALRMQDDGTALQVHQRVILAEHDGVLLGQPALMPLYRHLDIPTAHYWQLATSPAFGPQALREDVRQADLAATGKWFFIGQPQRNLVAFKVDAHPILAAIERAGAGPASQFWNGILRGGKAEISLTADQSMVAYRALAAQGDMVAEAMVRGLVPPAPLLIRATRTQNAGGSEQHTVYLHVLPQMEGDLNVFNLSVSAQIHLPPEPQ